MRPGSCECDEIGLRHEAPPGSADRTQLGHRDTVAGDDERLPRRNSVDHLRVVVAQLTLSNGLGHERDCSTKSYEVLRALVEWLQAFSQVVEVRIRVPLDRLRPLFHDTELHEHKRLLRICRQVDDADSEGCGDGELVDAQARRCKAGTGASVAQVPEPRRKVSSRYRSHGVKDEPDSYMRRQEKSASFSRRGREVDALREHAHPW